MPRPSQARERREELVPTVARTFAELGYRRATTAELARRCGVQENILYRLWQDKRAMFVAAIEYVFDNSLRIWETLLSKDGAKQTPAERLLVYEASHHGEFGLHRVIFAGLSETDDAEIRAALARMYKRFAEWIAAQVAAHRGSAPCHPPPEIAAWAIIGLGTVSSVCRETGALSAAARKRLVREAGRVLLEGR